MIQILVMLSSLSLSYREPPPLIDIERGRQVTISRPSGVFVPFQAETGDL